MQAPHNTSRWIAVLVSLVIGGTGVLAIAAKTAFDAGRNEGKISHNSALIGLCSDRWHAHTIIHKDLTKALEWQRDAIREIAYRVNAVVPDG